MVESVIMLLIYICVVVGLCWLILWVAGQLGLPLPAKVIQIAWVIVVLLCILLVWRVMGPVLQLPR